MLWVRAACAWVTPSSRAGRMMVKRFCACARWASVSDVSGIEDCAMTSYLPERKSTHHLLSFPVYPNVHRVVKILFTEFQNLHKMEMNCDSAVSVSDFASYFKNRRVALLAICK